MKRLQQCVLLLVIFLLMSFQWNQLGLEKQVSNQMGPQVVVKEMHDVEQVDLASLEWQVGKVERTKKAVAVFLHIHKAGGTSVCHVASVNGESTFREHNCNLKTTAERIALAAGSVMEQKQLIDRVGKSFIGNEWVLPNELYSKTKDVLHLTMMRHPILRTESHYAMASQQVTAKCARRDLDDAKARIDWMTHVPDNFQVRAICGMACASVPFGRLKREHLRIAQDNLRKHFAAIGILEHFPASILLFNKVLKWKLSKPIGIHAHKGSNHKSNQALAKLREHELYTWYLAVNLYDIELYDYAKDLFRVQLQIYDIPWIERKHSINFKYDHRDLRQGRSLLEEYLKRENCTTTCCTSQCAHVGKFWEPTALALGLLPSNGGC